MANDTKDTRGILVHKEPAISIVIPLNVRRKNLSTIAADTAAFNAQKDTGYKTLYQYLWHQCAAEYDQANG